LRPFAPLAIVLLAASPAWAQYEEPKSQEAVRKAFADQGLPPFLASMQRRTVRVEVVKSGPGGAVSPVGADLSAELTVLARGSKVKTYKGRTDASGVATFEGVPSNPEVQAMIGYEVRVTYGTVIYPFQVDALPAEGQALRVRVRDTNTDLSQLRLEHGFIEVFPDEDALVVRHKMRIYNDGDTAVDLGALTDGGLLLPIPADAKHPEVHDEKLEGVVEVLGKMVWYRGAILPRSAGPTEVSVVYTIRYGDPVFEWNASAQIRTSGGLVVIPRDPMQHHQRAVPLGLEARGGIGAVDESVQGEKRFWVLRANNLNLAPGEPFRFAVTGLPMHGRNKRIVLGGALVGVLLFVLFGFRGEQKGTERLSRAHLIDERERLLRALARMRRAVERGQMTQGRFDREQEAVTARLVSIYRALDRLES
jgi:hypothetical protein